MARHFKCFRCKELWDGIISIPFIKEGQVFPVLKEPSKEALKLLSFAFRELDQHLLWRPLRILLETFVTKKDDSTAASIGLLISSFILHTLSLGDVSCYKTFTF